MEVFVHIGFPKTGSTAIQSHVFTNRQWFIEEGVYIPTAGYDAGAGHPFLFSMVDEQAANTQEHFDLPRLTQLGSELREAEGNGFKRALLTWEGLATLDETKIAALRDELAAHSVTVIAYVREQAALLQSAVIQGLESLRPLAPPIILEREQPQNLTPEYIDFFAAIDCWRSHLKHDDSVVTRLYDRARLEGGDVVIDLLECIGLQPNDRFNLQVRHINHSLDATSAALLLVARAVGTPYAGQLELTRALAQAEKTASRQRSSQFLNREEMTYIKDFYADSNTRFFGEFPPGNADPQMTEFSDPAPPSDAAQTGLDLEHLRHIHQFLRRPAREMWEGATLRGRKLALIAGPPNAGWRGPEHDGIWTVGSRTELSFYLPDTHPACGPTHVVLSFAGHYMQGNTETVLAVGTKRQTVSLADNAVVIPIDDNVRENGVYLVLEHQHPVLAGAPDTLDPDNGLSYKLVFLSYNFRWDTTAGP